MSVKFVKFISFLGTSNIYVYVALNITTSMSIKWKVHKSFEKEKKEILKPRKHDYQNYSIHYPKIVLMFENWTTFFFCHSQPTLLANIIITPKVSIKNPSNSWNILHMIWRIIRHISANTHICRHFSNLSKPHICKQKCSEKMVWYAKSAKNVYILQSVAVQYIIYFSILSETIAR